MRLVAVNLNQSSSSAFCTAVRVGYAGGGEFLIWAAGRERPDEGLVELFSVEHEGMRYAGAVASGDKVAPIVVDEQGETRGRCALTLFDLWMLLAPSQVLSGGVGAENAP